MVGAGGFGREVAEAVRAINQEQSRWELLGFLDDGSALQGCLIDGVPVLGTLADIKQFPQAHVVVCTGHPGNYFSRKRLVNRLGISSSRYATLIHPTAVVPANTEVGPGTVLLATVVATTMVRLGAHVAVMPGVVLTHDDVIEDYVTMGAGGRLAGRVRVCEGAYIGAGVVVRENLSIGPWALIGMGAVVLDDVPSAEVWAGIPAHVLRKVVVPPDMS